MLKTYSPKDVVVSVGGVDVRGYSDGTFITIDRSEDAFSMVTGSDGETTRSKNANESGSINITLKGSSASNDRLAIIALKDEKDGSGIVPVIVKDNSGTTVCASCLLYTSTSPRDRTRSRMPSSA